MNYSKRTKAELLRIIEEKSGFISEQHAQQASLSQQLREAKKDRDRLRRDLKSATQQLINTVSQLTWSKSYIDGLATALSLMNKELVKLSTDAGKEAIKEWSREQLL